MTCGQLPVGGCANPDLGHDGPCTPWPESDTGKRLLFYGMLGASLDQTGLGLQDDDDEQ